MFRCHWSLFVNGEGSRRVRWVGQTCAGSMLGPRGGWGGRWGRSGGDIAPEVYIRGVLSPFEQLGLLNTVKVFLSSLTLVSVQTTSIACPLCQPHGTCSNVTTKISTM